MYKLKKSQTQEKKSLFREAIELIPFIFMALAIIIPLRMFIAQPFIVNGDSMKPTFKSGDYLIIDEISYRINEPQRGQVVVFRLPSNTKRFLIKRIVGLPGETIAINGSKISITKTNQQSIQLNETYIEENFSSYGTWTLKDNEYFVLGDNRNNSSDSRAWGILNKDLIVGKTFLRLFPLTNISFKPGEEDSDGIEISLPQQTEITQ